MSAEDYSHLACPNPDCPAYGQRAAGNLRLHGWSGSGHRIRYQTKKKVTDEELARVQLKPAEFHGEWNYTISPTR